jgi:hypothetical protein
MRFELCLRVRSIFTYLVHFSAFRTVRFAKSRQRVWNFSQESASRMALKNQFKIRVKIQNQKHTLCSKTFHRYYRSGMYMRFNILRMCFNGKYSTHSKSHIIRVEKLPLISCLVQRISIGFSKYSISWKYFIYLPSI